MSGVLDRVKQLVKSDKMWVRHDVKGAAREIYCKGCGTKIAGMMISDAEPQQVVMNEKLITVSGVEFVYLTAYDEGIMEFDDKSAHVTSGCKSCLGQLKRSNDPGKLATWYEQDLASWLKEIQIAGKGELHPRDLNRTPVRII